MKFRLHGAGAGSTAGKRLTPAVLLLAPFLLAYVACSSVSRLSGIAESGMTAKTPDGAAPDFQSFLKRVRQLEKDPKER